MSDDQNGQVRQALAELFSGYRAEWLAGDIFALFTEPSYFPQLTTSHPCFLVGGRGTGKTTALRCLSYQGQLAMRGESGQRPSDWPYYGMYYRVNTNRVNAFHGPEVSEDKWIQLFAHYVNLEFCELVIRLLEWFSVQCPSEKGLDADAFERVAVSLQLSPAKTIGQFARALELSRLHFEAAINNISDDDSLPWLSMQGAPIDQLFQELRALPQFKGKAFFFLIDEYENLTPLQQRVVNTLIKHCGELYSFKVGIKEFGLRERSTLKVDEQLMHPADYKLINITDELHGRFPDFASRVCDVRLRRALTTAGQFFDVRDLLPEISAENEAELLGVDPSLLQEVETARAEVASVERAGRPLALSPMEAFSIICRAQAEDKSLAEKLREVEADPAKWREHYDNYKHAYLFAIRRGKRGIRKYYCGWEVFCLLAAGNIRYLLELVDSALTHHLDDGRTPFEPVSAAMQTKAAQDTGSKNLRELAGLALSGAKLTRLLLGLGRVFQVMAEDPIGHTPEVNQFHLAAASDMPAEVHRRVDDLLMEAVMRLALVRYPASKLQEDTDVRQWDYAVHPIFSPFFGFSHRRKRKIELTDQDIWGFVDSSRTTIREILGRQNRAADDELPEQIQLFSDFYAVPD